MINKTKVKQNVTARRIILTVVVLTVSLIVVQIGFAAPADSIFDRVSKTVFNLSNGSRTTTVSPLSAISPSENNLLPTENWNIYADENIGFSFPYPEDWEIAEVVPGKSIRVVNSASSEYRGIEFLIFENADSLSNDSFLNRRLTEIYGNRLPAAVARESVVFPEAQGLRMTGFSPGIHTTVVFSHNNLIFWVSLIEGGEIEGGSVSNPSLAQGDLAVFNAMLARLKFAPK